VFVGGGPSVLGVLSNAYQTNRIQELINCGHDTSASDSGMGGKVIRRKGIAILETTDQFGGGNLQHHFGIRSNTSA
jgi:hypothetical protein